MSRIAGVAGKATERTVIDSMFKTMKKRGHNAQVSMTVNNCCLLQSQAAPICENPSDLPMACVWAGVRYTIVFDGAVYNKQEVYRELVQAGHHCNMDSDAEVALHAYVLWEEQALNHLNGIFAFAVWDHKEQKLFAARDRIGAKPFFYKFYDGVLYFASEIKTILAHPDVSAEIDSEGVAQLLLLGPGRMPGSGVFKDIYELKPGYYGECCGGNWIQKQYWKLTDREHTQNFEETAEHVRYLVMDAIMRQADCNIPIGTFLSGGLDSSIVSSVCADLCRSKGLQLQTFSVDYEDHEKYFISNKFQPESDRRYIDLMRRKIESAHLDVILSPNDLVDCMDAATAARDLPGMADVDFSLYAFSGQIRDHASLALSGECADEIFGGYPWYRDPEIRGTEGFPWAQNTAFRAGFIRPEHLKDIDPNAFVMDLYKMTVDRSDILPGTNRLERRMKELVNLNFEWFMQTLLDRNDRMTMSHDLEVRVPFCDYRIAEYLYGVPWSFKDYGDREKGLLRYAMRGVLPEEVLYRKKSPYPKTYDPRYLDIVSHKLQDVITDPSSPVLQLVRKDSLEKLLTTEFSWPWYGQLMKLPQTIAYMLQINRWMMLYHVKIV